MASGCEIWIEGLKECAFLKINFDLDILGYIVYTYRNQRKYYLPF